MKQFDCKIHLIQEALGTCPGDREIFENYVASKAPDAATMEEEIAAYGVDAVSEKGKTKREKVQREIKWK